MNNPALDIRIGTLVKGNEGDPVDYIRQILSYGFESFQLTFWRTLGDVDLARLADEIRAVIGEEDVVISALGIYGNPLENDPLDHETRQGWQRLIDHAHLFGTDVVAGFAGRLRDRPIEASMPRFKEIFEPLAHRAAERGVRLAFENCAMDGDWQRGDWNIAHDPLAWTMMFDAVPMDNLGLEWEPCHQMLNLIDPMPQLRQWVSRIVHVHGKCCTIHWDVVRRHGIHSPKPFAFHRTPGFGDCNWTDVVSDLRAGGFTGSIDIEGWHDPVYRDELEMTGQVRSLLYLKQCRGGTFIPNPTS